MSAISASQAVGGVSQGSYTPPKTEPVTTTPAVEPVQKTTEKEVPVKSSKEAQNQNGGEREPSKERIKKAVADINKHANGTEAVFGIHEATNRVTIKIVDKESKEIIKELPAEKTLDLIAKAWEMAGILVDEKR